MGIETAEVATHRAVIQYDDGKSPKSDKDKVPQCTRRGRPLGFYVLLPDGTERPLNIGFMRVGEMSALESLLNEIMCFQGHMTCAGDGNWHT